MVELTPSAALGAVFAIFIVSRILKYLDGLKRVNHWPGIRCLFIPFTLFGAVIPTTSWNPGVMLTWKKRFELYQQHGRDTISLVPYLDGRAEFYTANLDVIRQVVAGGVKSAWVKPEDGGTVVKEWGMNLFTTEREVWQRHRRIIGPAFNNSMYALVWEEAIGIYQHMSDHEGWSATNKLKLNPVQKYTSKFAFLVVAICGFGMDISWPDMSADSEDPTAYMSIPEALRVNTTPSISKLLPRWCHKLPIQFMRKLTLAQNILAKYMQAQVDERREQVQTQIAMNEEGERDIFSLLVRATETNIMSPQNNKLTLTTSELIGNVFLLLFAGHETTAHTLAATFALLAAHPDIQEEIYAHIIDVVGPDRIPVLEDYHKLDKVLCAFYEAARMFPAVYVMLREATEDTKLVVPTSFGDETTTLAIPKGTRVIVDTIGLQYNPRYYPEPEKFIPSRWYGEDKADSITAFSIGPRNCIGRRFATTEAVAFLTMWLRDWKVEPLLDDGETVDQWCKRVLDARLFLTLGVKDAPIQLTRRRGE